MKDKKEYFSIPELAAILGISRIAVYRKVKNKEIMATKIGRNYAVPARVISGILGKELNEEDINILDRAVKKTVKDYGETLRLLGRE